MNIALIGYGKLGQAIEKIAVARGHSIAIKIGIENLEDFTEQNLKNVDVAIESTSPESAFENISQLLSWGVPVVSGSTGWTQRLEEVEAYCVEKGGAFLYASNFSLGVNIFFELNKKLAALMAHQPDYAIEIEEIHHTQKKDAPSGTAITIAEGIMSQNPQKQKWENYSSMDKNVLPIISKRIDPAPGTHSVRYTSDVDDIEITHTAHNRTGFASGAVIAAEFLLHKKGVFSMRDVLGL